MNAFSTAVKMVNHPLELISDDIPLEVRLPQTITEVRTALQNIRGEKDEGVRLVMLRSQALFYKSGSIDVYVYGPKDGRPLIVEVESGMVRLNVMSGRVLIWANSSWGNSVESLNDSQVEVVVSPERKATIIAHHQSKVIIHKGEGSWGLQYANDDAEMTYAA